MGRRSQLCAGSLIVVIRGLYLLCERNQPSKTRQQAKGEQDTLEPGGDIIANDLVIDGQPEAIDAILHAIVGQVGLGRHLRIALPSGKVTPTARPTDMTDEGQFQLSPAKRAILRETAFRAVAEFS